MRTQKEIDETISELVHVAKAEVAEYLWHPQDGNHPFLHSVAALVWMQGHEWYGDEWHAAMQPRLSYRRSCDCCYCDRIREERAA